MQDDDVAASARNCIGISMQTYRPPHAFNDDQICAIQRQCQCLNADRSQSRQVAARLQMHSRMTGVSDGIPVPTVASATAADTRLRSKHGLPCPVATTNRRASLRFAAASSSLESQQATFWLFSNPQNTVAQGTAGQWANSSCPHLLLCCWLCGATAEAA